MRVLFKCKNNTIAKEFTEVFYDMTSSRVYLGSNGTKEYYCDCKNVAEAFQIVNDAYKNGYSDLLAYVFTKM